MKPFWAFTIAPLPISVVLPMLGVRLIDDGSFLAAFAFFYMITLASQFVIGVPVRLLAAHWRSE